MTATVPSAGLAETLDVIVSDIGEYPHAALNVAIGAPKTQTTRMLKVECVPCEYVVRLSRKVLDMGAPLCGVCEERMTEAE